MRDQQSHDGVYCIIGAGASGLAVAKTFKERGIPFDCLEREAELGGLWNAGTGTGVVYKTCHMVSSIKRTGYEDFPFPEDAHVYPGHAEALAYLKSYALEFGLLNAIEFSKPVRRATHVDGAWRIQVEGESGHRAYAGLILANGHHDKPRWPTYPGRFTGEMIHSRDYKGPERLSGKRVLIVGAGNTGCDIVVDGVHHALETFHSMRRGYYFVPKFTFGFPTDGTVAFMEQFRPPRWLKQFFYAGMNKLLVGPAARHGLPVPEQHILDTHPTVSSEIPSHVAHGRLKAKPDIERFEGRRVYFVDGSSELIDLVIMATGYHVDFPMMDERQVLDERGMPKLYLNTFHPERDDLFAAGLVQANGSIWRLADWQAKLIASYIVAMQQDEARAAWFRALKSAGRTAIAGHGSFVQSQRHALEHDYYVYRRILKRTLRRFGTCATAPYQPGTQRRRRTIPRPQLPARQRA